jgi:hypothetical protein
MSIDTATTTHAAGPVVRINGRTLQRCIICGYLLVDSSVYAPILDDQGRPQPHPTWPVSSLVRFAGKSQVTVGTFESKEQTLPPDICIDLVEG